MPPIRVSRTGWFPDQVRKTMKEHIAAKKKKMATQIIPQ